MITGEERVRRFMANIRSCLDPVLSYCQHKSYAINISISRHNHTKVLTGPQFVLHCFLTHSTMWSPVIESIRSVHLQAWHPSSHRLPMRYTIFLWTQTYTLQTNDSFQKWNNCTFFKLLLFNIDLYPKPFFLALNNVGKSCLEILTHFRSFDMTVSEEMSPKLSEHSTLALVS